MNAIWHFFVVSNQMHTPKCFLQNSLNIGITIMSRATSCTVEDDVDDWWDWA